MYKQYLFPRNWMIVLLVFLSVGTLAMTACSPDTLAVGIEPTPTLTPLPTPVPMSYVNDDYGFAFAYPETWTLTEEPGLLKLSQGSLSLHIAYGWMSNPGFSPRTGLPAGDLIYGDKIFFLEQMIPAQVLEYERKDKMVFYGGPGPWTAGDLAFSIWLEDTDSADYAEVDIPREQQVEVKEILESFEWVEATGKPPAATTTPTLIVEKDLVTYVNDDYRLAFIYPSNWELEEVPAGQEVPGGKAASTVYLTKGTLRLMIQFKGEMEATVLGPGGLPAGDVEERGVVTVFAREIPKHVLVFEGKVKSVFLNEQFDDLAIYVQLDDGVDTQTGYAAIDIPESVQSEMATILSSMTRTGEPASSEADTLTYENAAYGFSFQYPATWAVEEVVGETVEQGGVQKLADGVVLTQGRFKIVVQYQLKSDPTQIAWGGSEMTGGLAYGEATLGEPVTLLGEETHKLIWAYNGGIKAIAVNTTGESADLVLSITLADGSVVVIQDAEAATIPESAIAALDQILSSFVTTQ
jgi:hypothetical protein